MITMTKKEFAEKYNNMTAKEFAKELGCSTIWVNKLAAKHNIKKRNRIIEIID